MAQDLYSNLPPEIVLQQQGLNRQQEMAKALLAQGAQQNAGPSGQMVSGRYVPNSFFQNLQGPVNQMLGAYLAKQGDVKAAELAKQLREGRAGAEESIINKMTGTPAQATELAGPYAGQVPMPVAVQPAVAPNLPGALREIRTNPYGAGKEYTPTILKQMMPEATPEEKRYKAAIADGSWKPSMGGFNAFINQMSEKDKASLVIDKARLGIAQQQLAYDTGIGMPGMGGGQSSSQVNMGGQGGANNQFAPATMPQYQYNPSLSPKQNQEQAGKFAETMQKNVINAKDSFDLMKSASEILKTNKPSSGRLSNIATGVGEFFGGGGEASKADASLTMLSGALTMKQPRFEGPQGVLDVTLYQKLAGDLGNPNVPIPSRLATMKQMVDLQKKYYPNGEWDSIKTELDKADKVSLGAAAQYAVNPQTGERKMSTDGGKTWNPAR